jgi:hypothetical protein
MALVCEAVIVCDLSIEPCFKGKGRIRLASLAPAMMKADVPPDVLELREAPVVPDGLTGIPERSGVEGGPAKTPS